MMINKRPPSTRIPLLYALFGIVWIFATDQLVAWLAPGLEQMVEWQTYKGWIFVAASTILIFLLLRRAEATQEVAARALRESEARFRRLAESAPDLIYRYRLQPQPGFEYVSPAATRITGYTPQEHYDDPQLGYKLVHPEDRHLLGEASREAVVSGEPLTLRWIRKDGAVAWTEQRNVPIYNDAAELIALEGIARDVTVQIETREALVESERRFRKAFEEAPYPIMIHAEDGEVLVLSHVWEELTGYERAEIPTIEAWTERAYGPRQEEVRRIIDATYVAPGRLDEGEFRIHCKGGEERIWAFSSTPLGKTPDGRKIAVSMAVDVTERKQAEEKLRASERQYRNLVETSHDLLWSVDREGRITYINQAAERIYGRDPAEMVGRFYTDFISPEQEATNAGTWEIAAENDDRLINYENWVLHKDGTPVCLNANVVLRRNSQGEVIGSMGSSRDVTAQREMEQALRQRNHFIETILDNLPIGLAVNDRVKGVRTYMNREFVAIYGWPRQKLAEMDHFLESVFPDPVYRKQMQERAARDVASGDPARMGWDNVTITTQKGEKRIVSTRNIPLVGQNVMISTVRDITQRVMAERAERKQRRLAETLQESAETLLAAGDLEETLEAILDQLAQVVHYDLAEVWLVQNEMLALGVHRGIRTTSTGRAARRHITGNRFLLDSIRGEKPLTLNGADIEDHPDLPGISPLLHAWIGIPLIAREVAVGYLVAGRAGRVEGAYEDDEVKAINAVGQQAALAIEKSTILAELEISVRQLRDTQEQLVRAARLSAIGETAAGVAHQVNNPLTTIVVDSHLLLKNLPEDDVARESAEAIHQAALRAADIVQRMLDFSRTRPTSKAPLDVGSSIEEAARLIRAQLPENVQLQVNVAANLPHLDASAEHLHDVWVNLILNARDAVQEQEEGRIRVDAVYREAAGAIEVSIADNGRGMSPAERKRVFDPFFTTKTRGTGLGLAVSRDIIRHHGGEIRIAARSLRGSTFIVVLPARS